MNKKSLRFRILFLLLSSLALLAIVSLGSLYYFSTEVKVKIKELEKAVTIEEKIGKIKFLFGHEIQEWKNTIIRGSNAEAYEKHTKAFDKVVKELYEAMNMLRPLLTAEEKTILDEFEHNQKELNEKYVSAREKFLQPGKFLPAEADSAVKGLDRKLLTSLLHIDEHVTNRAEQYSGEALAQIKRTIIITLIINLVVAIAAILIAMRLVSQLTNSISKVAENLSNSANEVSSATKHIAASSEELSQAMTEQASSLQETSSSVEEINSMINSNSENARQSTVLSVQSRDSAIKGKEVVTNMMSAMGDISSSNDQIMGQIDLTNKEIENIVTIINEIGAKTKVINDIVFQTKLLSFNASVEAARAGEQGKGFAVVAEEVGNLAAMSGAAALEISSLLESSTNTVETIVANSRKNMEGLIKTGKEKVETGKSVAQECEQVLGEIVEAVTRVSSMINEIATASSEQAQGVQEITRAIAQLDQVTQQNSSNSAESANTAHRLSEQAVMLNSVVQNLVTILEGQKSA